MSDETVNVKVSAAIDGLVAGMNEASHVVHSQTIRISESFAGMGSAIARFQAPLLAVAAILGGGKLFSATVEQTSHLAEELEHLSQKTGIAATELSRLQFAAKMVEVDLGGLEVGLKKLSVGMSEALVQPTSKAALAFRAMGLDADKLRNDMGSALDKIADKFKSYEDGAKKSALAVALFGRSGTDMIPFLNLGSEGIRKLKEESDKLGATMSGPLIKAGVEYDEVMKKLHGIVTGFQNAISIELLPILTKLANYFLDVGPGAIKAFRVAIELLKVSIDQAAMPLMVLTDLLVAAAHAIAGNFAAAREALKEIPNDLNVIGRAYDRLKGMMTGGLPPVRITAGSGKKDAPGLESGKPFEVSEEMKAKLELLNVLQKEYQRQYDEKTAYAIAELEREIAEEKRIKDHAFTEENKRLRELQRFNAQIIDDYQKKWESIFGSLGDSFRTMVDGILRGTQTLGQAWNNLARNILLTMVANIEKAFEIWLATEMTKKAFGAQNAKTSIFNDAYKAAAGAYASASEIPVVGWILAPAIAAGAFAAVAAFGTGIKSAAGGYDIPGGVNPMTQLHAREMVLPARLADGIRGMIDGGSGGGSVTVYAMDAASFTDYLHRNREGLVPALRSLSRDGAFSSTRIG